MTAPYDFGGTLSRALAVLPKDHALLGLRMQCARVRPDGTVAEEVVDWEIETYGPYDGRVGYCCWGMYSKDGDVCVGMERFYL